MQRRPLFVTLCLVASLTTTRLLEITVFLASHFNFFKHIIKFFYSLMSIGHDIVFAAFAKSWRVSDATRRLIYNLLRSPAGLWDALKECYNDNKPELSGKNFQQVKNSFPWPSLLFEIHVCPCQLWPWKTWMATTLWLGHSWQRGLHTHGTKFRQASQKTIC